MRRCNLSKEARNSGEIGWSILTSALVDNRQLEKSYFRMGYFTEFCNFCRNQPSKIQMRKLGADIFSRVPAFPQRPEPVSTLPHEAFLHNEFILWKVR